MVLHRMETNHALAAGHVCTYGEGHPGVFMRSDATQIQRHLNRIFLEIRAHNSYLLDRNVSDRHIIEVSIP
jgi:hypothetical protein